MLVLIAHSIWAQPTIVNTSPNRHAFSASTGFVINFSEAMDNTTITTSTVVVQGNFRGKYAGSFSYGATSATFTPSEAFLQNEIITVTITTGVENASNVALDTPYVVTYTKQPTAGPGYWSPRENYTVNASNYTAKTVLADLNGDGHLDVVALTPGQDLVSIFINDGNGSYGSPTTYATATNVLDVVAADVNNDGDIDVITANLSAKGMSVFDNNGSGILTRTDYDTGTSRPGYSITAADFDGDGWVDIVISDADAKDLNFFFNDGDGTFDTAAINLDTVVGLGSLQIADITEDGKLDVVAIDGTNEKLRYIKNNGSRSFTVITTEYSVGINPSDLFVASLANNPVPISANSGSDNITTWQPNTVTGSPLGTTNTFSVDEPQAVTSADYNNDGYNDIVVSNSNNNSLFILDNDGAPVNYQSTFTNSSTYPMGSTYANHLSMGDIDGDGDLDIITANQDGTFSVIKNYVGPSVTSITPANGSVDFSLSGDIVIKFSEPMDGATMNATNITIVGTVGGTYTGTYTYNAGDSTVTFDPSTSFAFSESVTVMVTTNVRNSLGFSLGSSASSTFSIEGVNVSSTSPVRNAVNIALNSNIAITFNTAMDNTTLTTSNIKVYGSLSGFAAGTIDIVSDTGTFNPTSDFTEGEVVTVTITTGVESSGNIALENPYSFTFQVISSVEWVTATDVVYATGTAPYDVKLADVTGNGHLDALIPNYDNNSVYVRINNGSGEFTTYSEITTGTNPTSISVADFDGIDGIDFVVTNFTDGDISVFLNDGAGNFSRTDFTAAAQTVDAVVADFDGDGDIDIIAHNRSAGNATIFLNDGNGSFTNSGSIATTSNMDEIFAADIDNDGDMDIAVGGAGNTLWIAKNNRDGTFAAATNIGFPSWDAVFLDVDGDDYVDLITADRTGNKVSVRINDGTGIFGSATDYTVPNAMSLAVADYGSDGDLDIFAADFTGKNVQVLVNNGSGTFSFGQTFDIGTWPEKIAVGDIDGDGDMDFVSVNRGSNNISVNLGIDNVFVTATSPANRSTTVARNANITATFNHEIDDATLTSSTVLVHSSYSGKKAGSISYDNPSKTLTFNPTNDFFAGEEVTVTFTTGIENTNGSALTAITQFSFSIEASGTGVGYFSVSSTTDAFNNTNVSTIIGADIDNDGDIDFIGNYNGTMTISFNDGTGAISSSTNYTAANLNGIYKADFDNDGDIDFLGLRGYNSLMVFFVNDGTGVFSASSDISTTGLVFKANVGDFDNDGWIDYALFDFVGSNPTIKIFKNEGNFSFTEYATIGNLGDNQNLDFVSRDLDNDGDLDIVIGDYYGFFKVVLNNSDGTFAAPVDYNTIDESYAKIEVNDFDGDGYADIAVMNLYSDPVMLSIFINNGDGTFGAKTDYPVPFSSSVISSGDLDGDGDLDLVFASQSSNTGAAVAFNDGNGAFNETAAYPTAISTNNGGFIVDFDGDGDLDILNANWKNLTYLENTVPVAPSSAASSLSVSNNFGGQVDVSWTNGDGNGRILLVKQGGAVDAVPTDDVVYTSGSFGAGTQIGTGNYVVYAGGGSSTTITGLSVNTTYHISVFEYNKGGAVVKYYTTSPPIGNFTTVNEPETAASSIAFSNTLHATSTIEWTNGSGQNRIVIVKEGSAVDATPVDNTSYTANSAFGSGTELGTGNFVVYNGNTSSVSTTGLSSETQYHVAIYEYNGADGQGKFKTDSYATANFTTRADPEFWDKDDGSVVITKADNADWNLSANQDRIAWNIWLTRQNSQPLYNVFTQSSPSSNPEGTLWALGTVEDVGSITFDTFKNTLDGSIGSNIVDADMVLFMVEHNIYVDIKFSLWTDGGNGGGFSYTRGIGTPPSAPNLESDNVAGNAVNFTGSGSNYLQIVMDNIPAEAFTVETWVKPGVVGEQQVFLSYGSNDEFVVGITGTNEFYTSHVNKVFPKSAGGMPTGSPQIQSTVTVTGTTTISANQWYHVAVTAELDGSLKLYVNGIQEATASLDFVLIEGNDWYPGTDYSENYYYTGAMDELRMWRTARSVSQIREYMHKNYDGSIADLLAYWQFNEGSGSTAADIMEIFDASIFSGAQWITSDIPIGAGSVASQAAVTTGTATVGNASIQLSEDFDNAVDIQVTEVEAEPNTFPSGFTAGIGDKYFVINLFGDPGTFSANLTLTYGADVITSQQESDPSTLTLFKRSSNSTGAWTSLGGATTAVASTGAVTWTGITSFSQFMAVEGVPYDLIQLADNADFIAFDDSTLTFASTFFDLNDDYADSTLTLSVNTTPAGTLYLDTNANSIYDAGTDSLVTSGKELTYTPSGSIKLRYSNTSNGFQTITFTLKSANYEDLVPVDILTVAGKPSLPGTASQNEWYFLSNPMTTTLGAFLKDVWTQGAVNADSPTANANIYLYNESSAGWQAYTADLDTSNIKAGTGLLAYLFAINDLDTGLEGDGWPKELNNYGTPHGNSLSLDFKNVDVDASSGTNGDEGWVLFGNPFGWSLEADSLINTIQRTDATANSSVYYWNPVSGSYDAFTSGEIKPYQAVFVRIMESGADFSITLDQTDIYNPNKQVMETDNFELTLKHNDSDVSSKIELAFSDNGKVGLDPDDVYYLWSFAEAYADIYSMVDDQKLITNHLPSGLDVELEVPININANFAGEFTLTWDKTGLPEGWEFELREAGSTEVIDLLNDSTYTFTFGTMMKEEDSFAQRLNPKTSASNEPNFMLTIRPENIVTAIESDSGLPEVVELNQNYPNPFNPTTVIHYGVPKQSKVTLEVYDILGRRVMTLLNSELKAPGRYNVQFNAGHLSSGIYIYRLVVGNKSLTKRMVLIK